MIEHGRDMFPRERILQEYPDLDPLLNNPIIDDEFTRRDKLAIEGKKTFHRIGQFAVLLVAGSAIFTMAEALIPQAIPDSFILRLIAVAAAGLGIVLQLFIIFTKQKEKWLLNRYASERLRSIKFQAYQVAQTAEDAADLKTQADAFFRRAVADLDHELNGGIAILRSFRSGEAFIRTKAAKKPQNAELADHALTAFRELRIKYQYMFANSEIDRLNQRRRMFNSTQDMVYLAAAALTFLTLGARLYEPLQSMIAMGWIEFIIMACFVVGATESILDYALLEDTNQSRYETYAAQINALLQESKTGKIPLPAVIEEMELICLDELAQFCASAQKISYRF